MESCQRKLNSSGQYSRFDGIENDGRQKIRTVKAKVKKRIQELQDKINSVSREVAKTKPEM